MQPSTSGISVSCCMARARLKPPPGPNTPNTCSGGHGPIPLLALLRDVAPSNPDAHKVLQRERGYFASNALRMQYPLFRKQGLPVGSGAVEGGAKFLVQQRMKRAGMRWSELGARAILHLRCDALSTPTLDRIAS
jgi:hypothetical protein